MIGGSVRSASASAQACGRATRGLYALAATTFALFAIWGSLFPFDFHPVPLATAGARFSSEWTAVRTDWSLTDLASNILLFVPIGLFLTATAAKARPQRTAAAAGAAFAASVALSAAVEFLQAFVPMRTPSVIDVAAEAVGAGVGVALWRVLGAEVDVLVAAALQMLGRSTRTERLLLMYCLVFAVAWLVPADFTLRPAEIGDKYMHQRLLLPFVPSPDAATRVELCVIVAAAIPLGAAGMLCGCAPGTRRAVVSGAAIAGASLAALELGQIPVFSRTTDGASLLAALAGAFAGALAAGHGRRQTIAVPRIPIAGVLIPVVLWFALAALVEWWPFHVVLNPARASVQMIAWSRAPFRLPSGPLDVVPGAALAVVAGLWLRRGLAAPFVRLHTVLVLAFGAMTFLVFETGRVLLQSAHPTLLSVALETAALGLALHADRILTPRVPDRWYSRRT